MALPVRLRPSRRIDCRGRAATLHGQGVTDSHPALGRRLTPTGEVWLYHSEPDRWDTSPVSYKASILEATPDAGESAEVVQGA
eukprot:36278-Pleurochrysis_carterae.AAC.1